MSKDSNIDLTDYLWCPAFIWQYANMLRYPQLDWVVNAFSLIKPLIKVNDIYKRDFVVLYRSFQAKISIWRNYKTLTRLPS